MKYPVCGEDSQYQQLSREEYAHVCLALKKKTTEASTLKEEVLKELEALSTSVYYEDAHAAAYALLCKLLDALGHQDVTLAYSLIDKSYYSARASAVG